MSKMKARPCCLVIDASVGRAAGTLESRHPTGTLCRDFLVQVRGAGYRMAWSRAMRAEWDKHQSTFAAQWLVTMLRLNKLRPVGDDPLDELRAAIEEGAEDQNVAAIMLKDAHLVEAALATDRRIASLDDTVRGHYGRLTRTLASLRRVMWVNPAVEDEQVVEWLEAGARVERSRQLRP
jgi:hypothetical protein